MIKRIFQDIDEEHLVDADKQHFLMQLGWSNGVTWEELLRSKRILLISEAGAGKTYECRDQACRLAAAGEAAFFVELASLASNDLRDLLGYEDETRLDMWLASQSGVATFFLDSYDELQLTRGSFEQALNRFVKGIYNQLGRVRVVVTTRPIPFDAQLVHSTLPIPLQSKSQSKEAQEEEFARVALRKNLTTPTSKSEKDTVPDWRTVALMPLSDLQIVEFAGMQGVKNADELLRDIKRRHAHEFARRPQDLIELCADWHAQQNIRTHCEQVEANIRIKLKPRDREDRGELTELSIDKAIEGASRLALAMWLTRRLTIRHSAKADNVQRDEAALDPAIILSDWTQDERKTLLERPLFGFASYGRVRFHHRSVSEFLAAKRLQAMRDRGMSLRALKRLLFTETKGKTIVFPSKRAISGWLALFNDDIFQAVRENEPELLLDEGDPASLTLNQRKQALRAYVERYGKGGWRGLQTPYIQIERFADPELADEISQLWEQGVENPEVRRTLLSLIEQGSISGCADIAYCIACKPTARDIERIVAIQALVAINDPRLPDIATAMVSQHPQWPDKVVREVVIDLFPDHLSASQLCQILGWLQWKKRTVSSLSWRLPSLINNERLELPQLEVLRDGLVVLISNGLKWRQDKWPHMVSSHQHLSSALAAICVRGLDLNRDNQWFHASVLALRLHQQEYDDGKSHNALTEKLSEFDAQSNKLIFWAMDTLIQSLHLFEDSWKRLVETIPYNSPIKLTVERDRAWVISGLEDKHNSLIERQMLLQVAFYYLQEPVVSLKPLITDQPSLLAFIEDKMKPADFVKEQAKWAAQEAEQRQKRERKEAKNRAGWIMLWREIIDHPDSVFSAERCENTAWNLFRVMCNANDDSDSSGWNRQFIESTFGKDAADRLRSVLMTCWRKHHPTLTCERPEDQRNTYLEIWRLGLAGVYAEAEDPDWVNWLTPEEAMLAARYSLVELNGLPKWIEGLAAHHPLAVEGVLGKELAGVLDTTPNESIHSMILQRIRYTSEPVARLFLPRLVTWLIEIDVKVGDESGLSGLILRLSQVIELISKYGDDEQRTQLRVVAQKMLNKELAEPLMLVWLPTLILLNPELGLDALENQLKDVEPAARSKAVTWFSALFNKRRDGLSLRHESFTSQQLLRLLRLAYQHVRPEDDAEHEGSFTPDVRDDAEHVRNAIVSALFDAKGEEGWKAKLAMASDPLFSHIKYRILAVAQEALAQEADSVLLNEQECVELDKKGEAPLTTNSAMFALLRDRLVDLDELLKSDVSPQEAWAKIDQERIMRREIARELQHAANGIYKVDQESVTADEKETDIRLRSTASEYETVIELKLGDNRSARDLRDTIESQLVKKYLSLETRRSGALLITLSKVREWDHPDSGERIGLEELKELLDDEARRVEREMGGAVLLTIHVLDLRPRLQTEKQSRSGVMKKRVNPA